MQCLHGSVGGLPGGARPLENLHCELPAAPAVHACTDSVPDRLHSMPRFHEAPKPGGSGDGFIASFEPLPVNVTTLHRCQFDISTRALTMQAFALSAKPAPVARIARHSAKRVGVKCASLPPVPQLRGARGCPSGTLRTLRQRRRPRPVVFFSRAHLHFIFVFHCLKPVPGCVPGTAPSFDGT